MLNSKNIRSKRTTTGMQEVSFKERFSFSALDKASNRFKTEFFNTPKSFKNCSNKNISEQPTKAKDFQIITPFRAASKGRKTDSTTVRIKFKEENLNTFQTENRSTASKTINNSGSPVCKRSSAECEKDNSENANKSQLFSAISSISYITDSSLLFSNFQSNFSQLSENNLSQPNDSSIKLEFGSESIMKAIYYNHPKLPVGKEDSEEYKITLINRELKCAKQPVYNSACKKRKYSELTEIRIKTPPKRYSKTGSLGKFFRSSIMFLSDQEIKKFRVFKDNDVIKNAAKYADLLIESEFDDDIQTDDEQIRMARQRIEGHLRTAIREFKKV
jgi:hypothetical protein